MLLLQRRVGESIFIGDDIKITILDASHRQVRIGIQAPRDVAVHREEIYQRIQLEKAGQSGVDSQQQAAHAPQAEQTASNNNSSNNQGTRIINKRDTGKNRAVHPFRRNMQSREED